MPTLLACLSTGKGTWSEISKLLSNSNWDRVFLITNSFGLENFTKPPNTTFVLINPQAPTQEITAQIKKQLHGQIKDFEVALNFVSGSGKEHMALLEAVLELGLNFRLTEWDKDRVITLGLDRHDIVP